MGYSIRDREIAKRASALAKRASALTVRGAWKADIVVKDGIRSA